MKQIFLAVFLSIIFIKANAYSYESGAYNMDGFNNLSKTKLFPKIQLTLIGIKNKQGSVAIGTCTGVALDQYTILTAAHCLYNVKIKKQFSLGDVRLYVVNDARYNVFGSGSGRKITYTNADGNIYLASKYSPQLAKPPISTYSTDLALIKLNKNLSNDKLIPFANTLKGQDILIAGEANSVIKNAMEFYTLPSGSAIFALGWGSHYVEGGDIYAAGSGMCQVINNKYALLNKYLYDNKIFLLIPDSIFRGVNNNFCTNNEKVIEPETGDSGGPLFVEFKNKQIELIGIFMGFYSSAVFQNAPIYVSLTDQNPAWDNELKAIANN